MEENIKNDNVVANVDNQNTNNEKGSQELSKKQIKLILGILLTVFVLAIIIIIVVAAVQSSSKETQFFSGKYDYVSTTAYDGVMIVNVEGDYKLVKDNVVISGNYTSLYFDTDTKTYFYTSANGYVGELDTSGNTLYSRKVAGTEISSNNRTSIDFYITEDATGEYVVYDGKTYGPYAKVYTYDEIDALYGGTIDQELLGLIVYEDYEEAQEAEEKRLDTLKAKKEAEAKLEDGETLGSEYDYVPDEVQIYAVNVFNEEKFNITDAIIDGKILTIYGTAPRIDHYSIPMLEKISFFDDIDPSNIYSASGGYAIYTTDDNGAYIEFVAESGTKYQYEVENIPTEILIISQDRILYSYGTTYYIKDSECSLASDYVQYGTKTDILDNLFFINERLYNGLLNEMGVSFDAVPTIQYIVASKVEYIMLNDTLYFFDENELNVMLKEVTYEYYDDEIYFISEEYLYDNTLTQIKTIRVDSFVDSNLILIEEGKYADFTLENIIENVEFVLSVGGFDGETIEGEYAFKIEGAGISTFTQELTQSSYLQYAESTQVVVGKTEAGGYFVMYVDESLNLYMFAGQDRIAVDNISNMTLIGEDIIVLLYDNMIKTYQLNKNSTLKEVATYYYQDASIASQSAIHNTGIAFSDAHGEEGYIGSDGKLVIKPMYNDILVYENFLIATVDNGEYLILNHNGDILTDITYVDYSKDWYKDYLRLTDYHNDGHLISSSGKLYSYVEYVGTVTNYSMDNSDQNSTSASTRNEYSINTDYTHYTFFVEGHIQILKVSNLD